MKLPTLLVAGLLSTIGTTQAALINCLGAGEATSIGATRAFGGTGTFRDTSSTNPYNDGATFTGNYMYTGVSMSAKTWNTTNDGITAGDTWATTVDFNPDGGFSALNSSGVDNYRSTGWAWTDLASGNFFAIDVVQSNSLNPVLKFSFDNGNGIEQFNVAQFTNGQAASLSFNFGPSTTGGAFDITWSATDGGAAATVLNPTFASTYTHVDATLASSTDISHSYRNRSQSAWYKDPDTGQTLVSGGSLGFAGFSDPNSPQGGSTNTYAPCPECAPEPSSALLGLVATGLLTLRRRR